MPMAFDGLQIGAVSVSGHPSETRKLFGHEGTLASATEALRFRSFSRTCSLHRSTHCTNKRDRIGSVSQDIQVTYRE
jgi:hypothetical protein